MSEQDPGLKSAGRYEIRLKGSLPVEWSEWFGGLEILCDDEGNTTLRGIMVDQAALHGLLDRVRDLGMTLLSVTKINS